MNPLLFALPQTHPMRDSLCQSLEAEAGFIEQRLFPDGESYLRLNSDVGDRDVILLADLSYPDSKFLPLSFVSAELRDMGARSIGLVAPYLCYMRQDKRFHTGEVLTSRHFARLISQQFDWLVTIDPHLHRYHNLNEVYSIPSRVVSGAPLIAQWLSQRSEPLLLVGPDAESQQWVEQIAQLSEQPFIVGHKTRRGDRDVVIELPATDAFTERTAVLIDDVISSGHTLLKCSEQLRQRGFSRIEAVAVHGLFAGNSDRQLLEAGLHALTTGNSLVNAHDVIDLAPALTAPITELLSTTRPT